MDIEQLLDSVEVDLRDVREDLKASAPAVASSARMQARMKHGRSPPV